MLRFQYLSGTIWTKTMLLFLFIKVDEIWYLQSVNIVFLCFKLTVLNMQIPTSKWTKYTWMIEIMNLIIFIVKWNAIHSRLYFIQLIHFADFERNCRGKTNEKLKLNIKHKCLKPSNTIDCGSSLMRNFLFSEFYKVYSFRFH